MKPWKRGFSITLSSLKFVKESSGFGYNHFNRISSNIFPTELPKRNLNPVKYINQKFRHVIDFYEELSGLNDMKLAQEKVEEVGDRLEVLQSERRQAFAVLLEIQSKLKAVRAQLERVRRGDDNYISLITEENKLIKEEEMQQEKFKDVEKVERDQFILFSHSVKTAHEKEKVHSQRTKYWSLIASAVGTVIGIFGSSLNSHKKQSELKKLIAETSNSKLESQLTKFVENVRRNDMCKYFEYHTKIKHNVMDDITLNASYINKMHVYLNEILLKTNSLLLSSEKTLNLMKNMSQVELYKIKSDKGTDALFINLQSFKDALCFENQQMRDIIWKGSLIIGGAIFLRLLFSYN